MGVFVVVSIWGWWCYEGRWFYLVVIIIRIMVVVEDEMIFEVCGSCANLYIVGVICIKVVCDFLVFINGDDRIFILFWWIGVKGEGCFQSIFWDEVFDVIYVCVIVVIVAYGL